MNTLDRLAYRVTDSADRYATYARAWFVLMVLSDVDGFLDITKRHRARFVARFERRCRRELYRLLKQMRRRGER